MAHDRNVEAAQAAIVAYERSLGEAGARDLNEGVIDLITDLLHVAREGGLETDDVLRISQMNYDAEKDDPEEGDEEEEEEEEDEESEVT